MCVNPLCRRKWKLLSEAALPVFCPSCKKWLDCALSSSHEPTQSTSSDYYRNLLLLWERIYRELFERLRFPAPSCAVAIAGVTDATSLLAEYHRCFPSCPPVTDVRNWSSMGQRKHPVVAPISRKYYFLCEVASSEPGMEPVYFIDWLNSYRCRQTVKFIVFPNPSISERVLVPLLVKALDTADPPEPKLEIPISAWAPKFSPPPQRPDWIPDTPASPIFLQQVIAARGPPGPLAQLLRDSRPV